MRKLFKSIALAGLLLSMLTASCNLVALTPLPETTPTTAASFTPTRAVPTATVEVPTASATPEFAPFCAADSSASAAPIAQCQLPVAEESSTFCIKKDAYNLILIDEGATYEVLTEGFRCTDAGMKDDKQMITCTGKFVADFAVNVCNPDCVVPTVEAAVTACPSDYNYDAFQGCCTQNAQQLAPNCQAYNFKTTSCVVRCFQFKKARDCKDNSWTCDWNEKYKICEPRR